MSAQRPIDHDEKESLQSRDRHFRLGLSHPYVLHSLLGLAALQLFSEDRSRAELYALSCTHNDAALRLARPHILHPTTEHADALFHFAATTSVHAVAEPMLRPRDVGRGQEADYVGDLLRSFEIDRGVRAVVVAHLDHLQSTGSVDHSKFTDNRDEVAPSLEQDYPQLGKLRDFIRQQCSEPSVVAGCIASVDLLFLSIAVLKANPENHSCIRLIQTWPTDIDKPVLDMCHARHPVALVILAHYAVMMSLRPSFWAFDRWPGAILENVEARLDARYSDMLCWPRAQIRKERPSSAADAC